MKLLVDNKFLEYHKLLLTRFAPLRSALRPRRSESSFLGYSLVKQGNPKRFLLNEGEGYEEMGNQILQGGCVNVNV